MFRQTDRKITELNEIYKKYTEKFNIVTCISDYRRVLDWIIGFIDTLQVITTDNYDTIANFHTTNNSTIGLLSLYLIIGLNNGYSSAGFSLDEYC
jgi:hypothetical protein